MSRAARAGLALFVCAALVGVRGGADARAATPDSCSAQITTAYAQGQPLRFGTLVLGPDARAFHGTAVFAWVSVTDDRLTGAPWTLFAHVTDLSDGGTRPGSTISGQDLGFVNVKVYRSDNVFDTSPNNLALYDVHAADPPRLHGAAGAAGLGGPDHHAVAHALHGTGAVALRAVIEINAPTSTEAGGFSGAITFDTGCAPVTVPITQKPAATGASRHVVLPTPSFATTQATPAAAKSPAVKTAATTPALSASRSQPRTKRPAASPSALLPLTTLDERSIPLAGSTITVMGLTTAWLIRRRPRRPGRHRPGSGLVGAHRRT